MMWKVVKRDGRIVSFEVTRIENAARRALRATGEDPAEARRIAGMVVERLAREWYARGKTPHVEEIQDLVEEALMRAGYYRTARAYILYREKRREAREISKAVTHAVDLIDEYLDCEDWRVHENSNMTYSLQGLNAHVSSSMVARYWLAKIYPPEVARAHMNGDLHIHDLGYLAPYCMGWNLYDLLKRGFGGVAGKVESAPPRHFRSALGQVVNFIYTLQGEAAGAQALSNFDTLLAPFVRYDRLSYREVKQAIQEFIFNVNVPTRVGFQTPFFNITFDLTCPDPLKNAPVVVGGEERSETYAEFQKEMDMINRAFCELMLAGDARGRIFTFPIPTYNITRDFAYENPNLEPLWEMTRKYGIPYFANFVNSDLKPEDVRSMCCRLRLDHRKLEHRGGGLFGAAPLTGSIGVVTINLPRIAYLSSSEEEFFERLANLMELAKTSLEIKRKVIEEFTERGLYPYSRVYLDRVKECSGRYWTNHFSTIGIVGMNEACLNFLGKPISDPEAKMWAIRVLEFMREKLSDFQEETGNLYNLEATPAEGTSYRLARIDRHRYPDIVTAGTKEAPYYTNSVHLPVGHTDDIFEILAHQDDLQVLFTGGTVVHLYVGEEIPDARMVRELVRAVVENFRLPYFSITPTFSVCPVHGYLPGKHEYCPLPHAEADLARYGEVAELEVSALMRMDRGAFRVLGFADGGGAEENTAKGVRHGKRADRRQGAGEGGALRDIQPGRGIFPTRSPLEYGQAPGVF
ncbi:ribonucleoside triphosphate reductase [Thermosulfurimonas sp. F29]|uniref:ribonucleoside triphosphate reductase n=1 Tax=Thermosulfurimonas sp. F29 TaxID=2867247 RepID=UPI001C82AB89|nr:ribonucleoside triphosphate reductase [Thermosulfurimonas sp. F29]MBX6424115.1 ribonucleoside triphosphate reductase [Thermosulfurimonas sp. F29]